MGVTFTWLGHSAFAFDIDGHKVLVDPFLTGNPLAPMTADEAEAEFILVSHAHGDHVGDTVAIAQRTGALVIANNEMCNYFMNQGVKNVFHMNPGGTYYGDVFRAKWTIAHHSSSFPDGTYGGQPNGFILYAGDYKLYFAGDTGVFLEMQLYGAEGLDVAFLPIGDTFTMGTEESLKAIDLLRPRKVVPMHYNTFEAIVQDVVQWARDVNSKTLSTPIVLDPGNSHSL